MEAGHGKEGEKRDLHTGSLRNETECWDKNSSVPGKFSPCSGLRLVVLLFSLSGPVRSVERNTPLCGGKSYDLFFFVFSEVNCVCEEALEL